MRYPWLALRSWAPFRIDALGLVTFLGAEEVNQYLGRLVLSRWLEYMPLLGAFVIAGDRYREKRTAFHLYNITSGITTSDLSSWFTRWMLAQDFDSLRSLVHWEIVEPPRKWWPYHLIAGSISFLLLGFLIVLTALSKDWYGLTNAIAMVISVVVRGYVLWANRAAIAEVVRTVGPLPGTWKHATKEYEKYTSAGKAIKPEPNPVARPNGKQWRPEMVKVLIVMSDSKVVTMMMPEQLIVPIFVKNPKPLDEWRYEIVRWLGWAAVAVHIISIGSAQLAAQIYTVVLLIVPTVLICWKVGCDDWTDPGILSGSMESAKAPYECYIGHNLKATIFEWPEGFEFKEVSKGSHEWQLKHPKDLKRSPTRRQDLYAWLNLSSDEEESMKKWDLVPHLRDNDDRWTKDYDAKKSLIHNKAIDMLALKNAVIEDTPQKKSATRPGSEKEASNDDKYFQNRAALQPMDV